MPSSKSIQLRNTRPGRQGSQQTTHGELYNDLVARRLQQESIGCVRSMSAPLYGVNHQPASRHCSTSDASAITSSFGHPSALPTFFIIMQSCAPSPNYEMANARNGHVQHGVTPLGKVYCWGARLASTSTHSMPPLLLMSLSREAQGCRLD